MNTTRISSILVKVVSGLIICTGARADCCLVNEHQAFTPATADEGDQFGFSISMSGERLVVGALFGDVPGLVEDPGVAWVYTLDQGLWTDETQISASDGLTDDEFGTSVSIDGDLIIVGSPFDDAPSMNGLGSAYVFVADSGGWTQEQKLIASDATASDRFGHAVAIDGELAVIGAPFDDIVAFSDERGSAYVFRRSGGAWSQEAKITAPSPGFEKNFGRAVAISGNTVIIGEPDQSPNGSGHAYIFVHSGGSWSHQATLSPTLSTTDNQFGFSVAIDGDVAVVGDPRFFNVRAYIFTRTGTIWTYEADPPTPASPQVVQSCDIAGGDRFGESVAIRGGRIIIGAPGVDNSGTTSGAAYVFDLDNDVWAETAKLFFCEGAEDDQFGRAVTIDGRIMAVGAPFNDAAATDQGQAYNFSGVAPCRCEADLNSSGTVNGTDLAILLGAWGACSNCSSCPEDLDGNCTVGGTDLALLLGDWGRCPGDEDCVESFMGGSFSGGEGEGELTEDQVAALLGFSDAAAFYDWIQSTDADDVQAAGVTLLELLGG